jgi:3-methyladenine DNA glycosylase/8-oxoguanine DNA glycosylase
MRKATNHLKKSDPILSVIIERVGACQAGVPPEFGTLAETIVYQQLNGEGGVTIFKRFAALARRSGHAGRDPQADGR